MEKVGWIASGIAAIGLLALAVLVVQSLPELKRYMKMESM